MPSPIGIAVPKGGSSCSKCKFSKGKTCGNQDYISATYPGKSQGDDRFIDGKTGDEMPGDQFCCNFFDWDPPGSGVYDAFAKRLGKVKK